MLSIGLLSASLNINTYTNKESIPIVAGSIVCADTYRVRDMVNTTQTVRSSARTTTLSIDNFRINFGYWRYIRINASPQIVTVGGSRATAGTAQTTTRIPLSGFVDIREIASTARIAVRIFFITRVLSGLIMV